MGKLRPELAAFRVRRRAEYRILGREQARDLHARIASREGQRGENAWAKAWRLRKERGQ